MNRGGETSEGKRIGCQEIEDLEIDPHDPLFASLLLLHGMELILDS